MSGSQADGGPSAVAIDGVTPDASAIAEGRYSLARPIQIYVKPAHGRITPGLGSFLAEFLGDSASGPGGYLTRHSLPPL